MRKSIFFILLLLSSFQKAHAYEDDLALIDGRRKAITLALDDVEAQVNVEAPAIIVRAKGNSLSNTQSSINKEISAVPKSSEKTEAPLQQEQKKIGQNVRVKGEVRMGMGINADGDAILNRANADLNERNYRMLSSDAYDRRFNTFDPAIYSSLKVIVDVDIVQSVSAHMNVTIDPWSYTGKTDEQFITSEFKDTANVQYLTWGNSSYTINRSVNTLRFGNGFNLPELKVKDGHVPSLTAAGAFSDALYPTVHDHFTVPSMKVNYSFQPIRELWTDINPNQDVHIRIFPMAYDNQALNSDDPLHLSNNKTWWEESPWLRSWQGGNFDRDGTPPYFAKGSWDRTLAFYTRDSNGQRLTALRGVSFDVSSLEDTTIKGTIATPKTLWQDYGDVTAVPASVRVKHLIGDKMYIGTTTNAHQGFVNNQRDAENYVGSADAGIVPMDGVKLLVQGSHSQSHYDERSPDFQTKKYGGAYYAALEMTSNKADDILSKDYFGLKPPQKTDDFYKMKLFWGRMDEKFDSSLSNYHETRKDAFWSRHLTFYPSTMRYVTGNVLHMGENDVIPFAIGDGLDYGRTSFGWRGDAQSLDGTLKGLADIRRVTNNKGDTIETVTRNELEYDATSRLTLKNLFVWDALPKTKAGLDPFVKSGTTGEVLPNADAPGVEDPSLWTESLGGRYQINDWSAINGVWEYTNDSTLATDNFPRAVLNSGSFGAYLENGKFYRQDIPYLYGQGSFDQAPYDFFHIFKTGLEINPNEHWHWYVDYTRNQNQFSGNIDDNMNHYGLEAAYTPTKKLGFFARYVYSQGYDINRLVLDRLLEYRHYNNVYLITRLIPAKDNLVSLEYGVGPAYNIQTSSTDPHLGLYSTPALVTQHLFRLIYERKF